MTVERLYGMLILKNNVGFSFYKYDGKYVFTFKGNVITVNDDEDEEIKLNGVVVTLEEIEELL